MSMISEGRLFRWMKVWLWMRLISGVEYKLPLADSIIFATAHRYEAIVWTQEADFRDLKNVRYYPK